MNNYRTPETEQPTDLSQFVTLENTLVVSDDVESSIVAPLVAAGVKIIQVPLVFFNFILNSENEVQILKPITARKAILVR